MYLFNYPRFLYALYRISRLKKPIVTIFGGKRADTKNPYYQQAGDLAGMLAQKDYAILTGGGPGIMESALCGALKKGKNHQALGIGVQGLDVEYKSLCDHETIFLGTFAVRKQLLIRYSKAFISFPGGIGTLDEILEVLNLIKTKKLFPVPIILIGKDYWRLVLQWMEQAIRENYIGQEYAKLITVVDTVEDAYEIIVSQLT